MNNKLKEKIVYIKISAKGKYAIVTPKEYASEDDFLDSVAQLLKDGVGIIQLKNSTLKSKELLELAYKLKNLCLMFDATFIVNDRIDIAMLCNADGIHLDKNSIDAKQARELLDGHVIIGISLSKKEANSIQYHSADYILIETDNNSKPYKNVIYNPLHNNEYQVPYFQVAT